MYITEVIWSWGQQPEEKTTARMTPVCWLSDLCQQRRAKTARYQCMSVRMTHGPLCMSGSLRPCRTSQSGWHRGTATSVGRFLCLTQPSNQVGSREQRQSSTPSMGWVCPIPLKWGCSWSPKLSTMSIISVQIRAGPAEERGRVCRFNEPSDEVAFLNLRTSGSFLSWK